MIIFLPGSNDELLALGAGVGIKVVRHDKEHDLTRDIAILLVLTCSRSKTENQQEVPGHANLEEHLEIKDAKHAGVKLSTHEEVIDGVASHAVLLASPQSREVSDEAHNEAAADGNRQERAELIEGRVDGPDTREVQGGKDGEGRVQADKGVAEIVELLAALVRKRLALAPDTRKKAVACTLKDEVSPVPYPCLGVRKRARVDDVGQMKAEIRPAFARSAGWEFATIKRSANPHIPHEHWEEDHHAQSAY